MSDTAMTPGGTPGEQVLVATVPTPMMDTAEGLVGEKNATSFGTYSSVDDGAGNDSMQNMSMSPDITDQIAGCDRSGSMSMQDMTGPQLGQPAHGNGGAGREPGHDTNGNPMSQYLGAYNSGIR